MWFSLSAQSLRLCTRATPASERAQLETLSALFRV